MAQGSGPETKDAWPPAPDVSHLITEDGEPVDSILSEKQMRLLTESLSASWRPGRAFFAAANVGVFAVAKNPALVPDVFLSVDVEPPMLTGPDRIRSYFVWEYGKPPDVVIEIVSDTDGGELSDRLRAYERMRVPHYVVFDPLHRLGAEELMIFTLDGGAYVQRNESRLASVGLGLVVWEGVYETSTTRWLRWTDLEGNLVPTGAERADAADARADAADARADDESARADDESARAEAADARAEAADARAEALVAALRALGIEP